MSGSYLDLAWPLRKDVRIRVVERPGRWMEPRALDAIVTDLRRIATAVVPNGPLDYGVLTGRRDALERAVITLLYDKATDFPVAFNALALLDVSLRGRPTEVVHLGLVMVSPSLRSRGMSAVLYGLTCILLFARRQLRPVWISNVTQVPAIVGMVAETFSNVYPRPDPDARRSYDHLALAQQIMCHHRSAFGVGEEAGFDAQRFVITNSYTGGSDHLKKTLGEAPKHRDAVYNDLCADLLDYDRGDDVLQIGEISLDTARSYLARALPRDTLPGVMLQLALIAASGLVLPIVHWLTPSQQMGELRPWR